MARNLTAGFVAQATAASNRPIVLFEGVFASSILRLWNGIGDLSWGGYTFLGNGWFQGMDGGEETTAVEAVQMTVILSSVPAAIVSLVLNDQRQKSLGILWIGFLDSAGAVVDSPYRWWQGYYSHAEIDEKASDSTIRLFYDSPFVDLDRPKELRWTHEAQQKLYPGDKGFEYVVAAANWKGTWGGQKKDTKQKPQKPKGSHKKR